MFFLSLSPKVSYCVFVFPRWYALVHPKDVPGTTVEHREARLLPQLGTCSAAASLPSLRRTTVLHGGLLS